MNYEMSELTNIAERAVNYSRGMGDPILAANQESWAPYLRFLGIVVKQYTPEVCLELGVYMGTATMHMALGSAATQVIGVDMNFHPDAERNLSRFPNVKMIHGNSIDPNTYLAVSDKVREKSIGLIFLDSTHDGMTPTLEYQLYETLFAEECLVVCDDLLGPRHLEEKMKVFWDWLPGVKKELHYLHPRLNTSYDEPGFGISIVRKDA